MDRIQEQGTNRETHEETVYQMYASIDQDTVTTRKTVQRLNNMVERIAELEKMDKQSHLITYD